MLKVQTNAVERVKDALLRSKLGELHHVVVESAGDSIALLGQASTFYHKQLAQELVRCELGGQEIVNHIQVSHPLPMQKY
jgi:hypothetical protein